ncbi:GTP cyclohydrolase I [Microbacterium sp. E-13]|uniref:GTP cyclohydrolase I n=1 Tax=Microbacterium sp. E-13 TaxID=3404048 RepID=UPI003CF31B24
MTVPVRHDEHRGRPRHGADRDRAVAAVRELLDALGEDLARPGIVRTPDRVADLFLELTSGIGADVADALGEPIPVADGTGGELIAVTGIRFRALCEHHLLPFDGVADVYYRPRSLLAGFGRIAALVDRASRRPQLQETLGAGIADALVSRLTPYGVAVRIEARHECMNQFAPSTADARVVTIAGSGSMADVSWLLAEPRCGRD